MLARILSFAVRRLVGGPAKSWLITSGSLAFFRFVKGRMGRRELIDLSKSKPGDKFVIEHLSITHKQQIKEMKSEKKASKRALKASKRATRRGRRS